MDETIGIETGHAIQLVKEHLAGNWLKATEKTVSLKVISGGYCSRLYLCQDLTGQCEPSKVLIRIMGGKILAEGDPVKHYNQGTESIVFFMHGHLGYGPKLYGVFKNGRLEEFIPSRTITDEDLEDASIRMQVARKLARFHSMRLPVSKKPHPPLDLFKSYYNKYYAPGGHDSFLQKTELCGADPSWVKLLDFKAELDWVTQTLQQLGGRLVLSTNDMNRNNILIRQDPDKFGEIVTIVDYEMGGTNWRGFDIATHFVMRMIDFKRPNSMSGTPYPNREIRREFVAEYLKETQSLNVFEDFDADGLDSVEHVLMEADLLAFIVVHYWVSYELQPKDDANVIYSDKAELFRFYTLCQNLVEFYVEQKPKFLERYKEELNGKTIPKGTDLEIFNNA